jgi:hypothetical protein
MTKMAKPGFIQHPWSNQQGDSICVTSVIQRIENEAMRGCGLYYEIFHHRVICQLLHLLNTMNANDRLLIKQEAAKRGFNLDKASVEENHQNYQETLTEIRNNEY